MDSGICFSHSLLLEEFMHRLCLKRWVDLDRQGDIRIRGLWVQVGGVNMVIMVMIVNRV